MAGEKKLVRSKSGLRVVSLNENNRCPFELSEPSWISDTECGQCTHCGSRFDFIKRRHHCRRCGNIFCNSCCNTKLSLPRMCFVDPVRVCEKCAHVTRKENDFYDKHLKALISGASFTIEYLDETKIENNSYFCKLSPDHRFLTFEGGENAAGHKPVTVSTVQSVQIIKTDTDFQGNSCATELKLVYDDLNEKRHVLHFKAASSSNVKQSVAWIIALQKALKMMFESQNIKSSQ